MKKFLIPAFAAAAVLTAAAPALAQRNVMVMVQQVPMTMPAPPATSPVTIMIKMDPATMAAMHANMPAGTLVLTCKSDNLSFLECHGK